jgi:hypothetical protein
MAALRHRLVHVGGTPGRNARENTTRIEDPRRFLDLAFGYYMSGRFAVINGLFVAPNLMHHAVELLIKYVLVKDVPESQRSDATASLRQKYGHRLNRLWKRYKKHVAPTDMSRFDRLIPDLDRWEKIRYGGFPVGTSVAMGMTLVRAPVQTSRQKDTYIFGLDEVDDLIAAIFAASDINPAFVGSSYPHTELPEWYKRHNAHIMSDLFR